MNSFGTRLKRKLIYIFLLNFCRILNINALLTVRSEMLPFSGNNQNIKMFGVPPEHFAIGYVMYIMMICHWAILHYTICLSKQLQEGLMVFSDDFLHFLKIKKKNC